MTENPLVSIIVTTYNQEKTIGRALDSLLSQKTDYSFEIIVGEDNSPADNTRAVCEEYAARYPEIIKLMPKAPNKGVLKNYDDCLNECRGKYISGCAGDDWWHNPNKIKLQVDFLENNPEYGLIHTNYSVLDVDSGRIIPPEKKDYPQGDVYDRLFLGNIVSAPTVMYKKSLLDYVDYKSFRERGIKIEDYPTWLEISKHTKFYYLDVDTVTYSIAKGSLSNPGDVEQCVFFLKQLYLIHDYFVNKYPEKGIDSQRLLVYYSRLIHKRYLKSFRYRKSFGEVDNLGFNKFLTSILHTYFGAFAAHCMYILRLYGRMSLFDKTK